MITHGNRPLFLSKRDGGWVTTSYAEFARLVDSVRTGLSGLGVGAGDRVGIISANRVEWAAVAYASYGLRAAVVPMYESQRDGDWTFVIRDAGVRVLFVSTPAIHRKLRTLADAIPDVREIVVFDDSGIGRRGDVRRRGRGKGGRAPRPAFGRRCGGDSLHLGNDR